MTTAYVLDASAVLALLHGEPGADAVAAILPASLISTVNWAEVIQKAARRGVSTDGLADEIRDLGVEIAPFSLREADEAGRLGTRGGEMLSLGDRACLAAARHRRLPAVTADRSWAGRDLGVEISLIR